jgi:hypothetical protein
MNPEENSQTSLEHTVEVAEELSHEMEVLSNEVHKQNSKLQIFWSGIISGFGRTVGATIIFGIIVAILSYVVGSSDVEWLNTLIAWLGLNTYLN